MTGKRIVNIEFRATICTILLLVPVVFSQNSPLIPAVKSQVNAWFNANVTLDPALVQAETEPQVIKMKKDGGGDFDTITKAIESVPSGNTTCTVDFIFGSGKSLYQGTELYVEGDKGLTVITAQARGKVHRRILVIPLCIAALLEQRAAHIWAGPGRPVIQFCLPILKWTASSILLDGLIKTNLNAKKLFSMENSSAPEKGLVPVDG
ncbi:hypothetical protein CRYUN_Cryun07bG0024800 [Craigia yunnanensis]